MSEFSNLEGFILEKMRESRVPGLSIAVVEDNQIKYARGFGFRDVSAGLPATPRSLFGIGSVTKSFTALAIMQLVEEGKLSLDDRVDKYVPAVGAPLGEARVHHLLTHSSGLPGLGYAEAFINGILGFDHSWLPVSSPDDVIAFMRDASGWRVSKPGEKFFYLNEGYVLLGQLISQLSGASYEEYVQKRILDPLEMERTYLSRADVEKDSDVAIPYIIDKEGKHIPSSHPYGITSDGGLISNVIDLSNYIGMCIGRGEFNGRPIVSKRMFETMEQPHIRSPYEFFGMESYGYGWGTKPDFYGYKLVGHAGSVGVYTAYVGYVPEKKLGVAVLANPSRYALSNIGMYALAQLMGVDPMSIPFVKSDKILAKLQGEYETYKGTMRINIARRGDFLYAEFKDRYTEEVYPLAPEKLEDDHAVFSTLYEGVRMTTEFRTSDDRVELMFERYKAVKKDRGPEMLSIH